MIKLEKNTKPNILKLNEKTWTINLLNSVKKYGGYSKIPKKEKDKLLSHYKNKEITDFLFDSSYKKCAFCECLPEEGGGYIAVEHFYPKSIYPEKAFEWNNLLPICTQCNTNKLDFDSQEKELINPYIDDPKEHFKFDTIILKEKNNLSEYSKSKMTKDIYKLNRTPLLRARANLLVEISNFIEKLEEAIKEINKKDLSKRKKLNRISKLKDILLDIEDLKRKENIHSYFINFTLNNSGIEDEANKIINEILREVK